MKREARCMDCNCLLPLNVRSQRKRCPECADEEAFRRNEARKLRREEQQELDAPRRERVNRRTCMDCGKPITQPRTGGRRLRCEECSATRNRNVSRELNRKYYRRWSKQRTTINVDKALKVIDERRPVVTYASLVGKSNLHCLGGESEQGDYVSTEGRCVEKFERTLDMILSGRRRYVPLWDCKGGGSNGEQ